MGKRPPADPGKLTAKQAAFVREYLVDLNATGAARRAGYKGNDVTLGAVGAENLKKPQIAQAVAVAQNARAKRVELTQDYVLTNLTEIVERCMQRAPVMVRDGKEWVQATDDAGRHVWAFNAKSAVDALGMLGDHLGLFKKKHEHSGPGGGPIVVAPTKKLTDGQLRAVVATLRSGADGVASKP